MNFFEHQEKARKKTGRLIFYFVLAIFLIIVSIDLIILGLVLFSADPSIIHTVADLNTTDHTPVNITPELILRAFLHIASVISPAIILVIVLGSAFRMLTLRSGGVSVAEIADATPIDPNTTDINERKFINVVEEMSIASGIAIPALYVMQNEMGINAFVAGIHPADTVMVVTKGALIKLNRDELQGVIGHEYSHIFNSDMQISVRLIGVLAGVLLIGQLGFFIIRYLGRGRSSSSSNKKGDGALFIFLLGLGLCIVGYIGLFFGRLIKAAISRERELLADACSVQFTRNPTGLVGALQKIEKETDGTYLKTRHAEDISHLCFCPSLPMMFTHLLDSHPPLDERINIIDPDGIYRLDLNKTEIKFPSQGSKPSTLSGFNALVGVVGMQASIGNPTDAHFDLALSLLENIPSEIRQASHNPDKVQNVYYALLLSMEPSLYEKGINIIQSATTAENLNETLHFYQAMSKLDQRSILPLIDISIPTFKTKSTEERRTIFDTLMKLCVLDKEDLFEFTFLGIIGKSVDDRTPKELKIKYSKFEQVIPSLTALLSFVIACGKEDEPTLKNRFMLIAKKLTTTELVMTPVSKLEPQLILPALKELNLLSPLCKQQLIKACLESIQEDQKITLEEAELVRGIAACLDCPIPPIVATE